MQYVALLLLAFLQVLLSILLSYKKHLKVSKIFLAFSTVLFAWTLANILVDRTYRIGLESHVVNLSLLNWSNRLGFFTGTITLIILYRMMRLFPVEIKESKASKAVTVLGIAVVFCALLPAVAGYYTVENSQPLYHYGSLSIVIFLYFVLATILSIKTVVHSLRRSIDPIIKAQTKTILTSLIITMATAILIITILPLILNNDSFIFLGYFSPYIFTAALFYSIFRQSFLDFRTIVARSLVYILSLTVLALTFVTGTLIVTSLFFGHTLTTDSARWVFAIVAVALAFLFDPIKRFFDKITAKVFFRDAYDPQNFLDEFNNVLVSAYELIPLLKSSAQLIEDNLKPTHSVFFIKSADMDNSKVLAFGQKQEFTVKDIVALDESRTQGTGKVLVLDEMKDIASNTKLRKIQQNKDISVVIYLSAGSSNSGDRIGYLILGPKKTGNQYSSQDIKLLEIIANELVIATQNALRFEEIKNFNATLQQRIDDATHKLRKANEKLKALDETKDDFISMASHQLRTPLTSVKGYISMVLEGDAGKVSDTQKEMLTQAFTSSQRMVYLIADLLNVSRLKTGKFVIERSPVNLADLVEQEIGQLVESAKARNIDLVYNKPKDFPMLMLDETKTRQVVMNFSDNGLYYTPAGGKVEIKLENKEHTVELRVVDNGIGVPKSEQHHLFTKFYRAGNARKARPDGTGLGLFMAKKVIVAQGGTLVFDSKEGKGSTFGFIFSKASLAVPTNSSNAPVITEKVPEKMATAA